MWASHGNQLGLRFPNNMGHILHKFQTYSQRKKEIIELHLLITVKQLQTHANVLFTMLLRTTYRQRRTDRIHVGIYIMVITVSLRLCSHVLWDLHPIAKAIHFDALRFKHTQRQNKKEQQQQELLSNQKNGTFSTSKSRISSSAFHSGWMRGNDKLSCKTRRHPGNCIITSPSIKCSMLNHVIALDFTYNDSVGIIGFVRSNLH